jgi:hypothetical protein
MSRKWLPTFAELIDRLSIHQLKEVFLPENKEKYRREMRAMMDDLDLIVRDDDLKLSSELIKAIVVLAQINEHIWYNEAKVRNGESQDMSLLGLTHSLNGIRNGSMNYILELIGERDRQDKKIDCLAADHSAWDIQLELESEETK